MTFQFLTARRIDGRRLEEAALPSDLAYIRRPVRGASQPTSERVLMATKVKDVLPNDAWLEKKGYKELEKAKRAKPSLFAPIPQEKKTKMR